MLYENIHGDMFKPQNISEWIMTSIIVRDIDNQQLKQENKRLTQKIKRCICKDCDMALEHPLRTLRCKNCGYAYCQKHFVNMIHIRDLDYCRECASILCDTCQREGGVFKCKCGKTICSICAQPPFDISPHYILPFCANSDTCYDKTIYNPMTLHDVVLEDSDDSFDVEDIL